MVCLWHPEVYLTNLPVTGQEREYRVIFPLQVSTLEERHPHLRTPLPLGAVSDHWSSEAIYHLLEVVSM